ncbi:gamma-glutamyltransferase family protein [Mycolicibacterium mageritense]|uniref:gamma-glutamyltransferase family protein n=1 Tax=Mycolicibacterium mageritense TaxID=53462 RepID=UPI001E4CA5F2|nr:gamma-glutamyltransferase [Mycolicibacterium mageritense]GJJ22155.1 gamma-glutamyltranspeptidase [Mycolicibacterium mageritense]
MPTTNGSAPFTGAIATPHVLATEAATAAFRDGGTAIDAAIAAAAVLTVVYPHNVALGGDLIALVRTPDGAVVCVNASGWAGAGVDVETMRARHGAQLPVRGADTVTVPGGVRGWDVLRSFGSRLPWARLLGAAERAAAVGVPVSESLRRHLADPENDDLHGIPDFDSVFGPLLRGEPLRQPALAATLRTLADAGPDEFYTGGLAARSVQYLRSHGSVLDAADFADFRPEVTEPISLDFRGLTVLTSPPNTHGFMMLRALNAIDRLGIESPLGAGAGTVMRVFHHGNRLRSTLLADPRMAAVDVPALVYDSPRAAAPLAETAQAVRVPRGDTVGIAAADGDGFAVSLIQSVYHAFGSGLVDPQSGILFHDRGTSFSLNPQSPNVLAARKRPLHTLMPVMTTRDGAIRHVLATMGGQGQPQILTQVLLRMVAGATPADAIAAPRAVVGPQEAGCTDDSVVVETGIDPAAMSSLVASGLGVVEVPRHTEGLGQANVVAVGRDGQMSAASDPRADGSGVVAQYPRHRRVAQAAT